MVPKEPSTAPLVLGLLGGVGSGKSTVARLLGEAGAAVLDADGLAREVLEEPFVAAAIRGRLGPSALAPGGGVDRTALARSVFGPEGEEARRWLESLIHPRVRARMRAALDAFRASADAPWLVVLDVPLLIEGPCASWCDLLVFVEAPEEARRTRSVEARGWDRGEVARREAAQAPLAEKRERADHVIRNDGSLDDLRLGVQTLATTLRDLARRRTSRMEEAERGRGPPRSD